MMQIVKSLDFCDIEFVREKAAQLPLVPRHMKRVHIRLRKRLQFLFYHNFSILKHATYYD